MSVDLKNALEIHGIFQNTGKIQKNWYFTYVNIFQLDKCVDGKLSCYGCNDEFDFDPLPGNTADPPIKLPHNPKPTPWGSSDNLKPDFLNKPPPKGTKPPRPDAPTLPPQARINVSLISNY